MHDVEIRVSEFVGLVNQTLEYAYMNVVIIGELANFRISKNRWVYFDLKDELAQVRFFGTIYNLPGPLEDGMMLKVRGMPRLHPQYGFSVTVQQIQPQGEGAIKKASELLKAKLQAEGLFDDERKRPLPYPPKRIGLITSAESAAYRDFMKILHARWGGVQIELMDVQVQGEAAVEQIVQAVERFNHMADQPDVLVITRGGGSTEDLAAFSTEQVTRAVASSRIPTVVAIGHEVDISLAELAADQRASTPSNAAELLVPDRAAAAQRLRAQLEQLKTTARHKTETALVSVRQQRREMQGLAQRAIERTKQRFLAQQQLLAALNPQTALTRGYAIIRREQQFVRSGRMVQTGDMLDIHFTDAVVTAEAKEITMKQERSA
ncbi:MAG TPA: exodeoxyribonuclease VII large subunit [Candidatus Saccharimonadales bacterium]|nr:exodeoxyribonuclease VII large subunit [Candidatus Saccharimonadales bacterium]